MRDDPETYRRYAEECQRLAKTMSEEHGRILVEMAKAWIELAQDGARLEPHAE
jgi:hypothetical protein